jgi:polyisoprenyl-phosphate glycosyltransferase
MTPLSLSIVVPVYSGSNYLEDLVLEIDKVRHLFHKENYPITLAEAIFVIDDAIDNSASILEKLKVRHEWVKVVELSRNYGQHPATMAGLLHASGDWIITLDEDLQHHPKFIPRLLERCIMEQKDVIYANPIKNVHGSFIRDIGSKGFKWLLSKLTGDKNIKLFNSYRLIRGDIARAAAAVSINQTYFDLALSWFTQRITSLSLPLKDIRYETCKKSGYSLRSLISHSWRMIQTSNLKIMRVGAFVGFVSIIISFCVILYAMIMKLWFPESVGMEGWASIIVSILFLGGVIIFILGIMLDLLSVLLLRNHGKPTFFYIDRSSDKTLKDYFIARYANSNT